MTSAGFFNFFGEECAAALVPLGVRLFLLPFAAICKAVGNLNYSKQRGKCFVNQSARSLFLIATALWVVEHCFARKFLQTP